MKHTYTFFNKYISGPFTIPSGVVTTEVSTIERIAHSIPQIGILTTKSIRITPKDGNREPVFARYQEEPNSFVNAVGLTNPGAEVFAKRLKEITIPKDKFLLISIFGATVEEFYKAAAVLLPYADGFELNVSCPHAKGYGQAICQDLDLVGAIIKKVKTLGVPVLVKISPNIDVGNAVQMCLKSGVDGFVAINTWGPKPQEFDGHPILTNGVGGVSGQAIRDMGIQTVKTIRSLTDVPIIGCGGIAAADDVHLYKKAGAEYFGIGSALINMDTKAMAFYFKALEQDLKKKTNTAGNYIHTYENFTYHKTTIQHVEHMDTTHAVFTIHDVLSIQPGQFIFLWIPGVGEKPFSVLDTNPTSIYVQLRGCFTRALLELKQGDTLYWRGPYGKPVRTKGKTLLVGAGTGIAALYLFAKTQKNTYALLGAKTKNQIVYHDAFAATCKNMWIATSQEGEQIRHVTDMLPEVMKKVKPTTVLICGPEQMVYETIAIAKKYLPETHILSSIEFVTKCGVGICGSCATKKGVRNCVDGTFFPPNHIL